MKGISAEKTLSSLRRNDHCDPEHAEPSPDPTLRPTKVPTYIPTAEPTSAPTRVPTFRPTSDPTFVPTAKPTSAPTSDPTSSPTQDPTYVPTAKPTSAPTSDPTSLPSSLTTRKLYPHGVQLNSVSVANLSSYGCSVCYLQTYSALTTSDNIGGCTGPVLFVGGRATSSSSFTLGAFDSSTFILTQTPLNIPHESNGVYWYFTSLNSFGFSRVSYIEQVQADAVDSDGDERLSWHVDIPDGGYRLGSIVGLNEATDYMKAIYNCPA